jgi:general secretion pathway protein G
MNQNYKKAFSLIELIFIIAILAIISSLAIPKLMNINSKAQVSVVKQDINTIISSVQSYYLIHNKIDKISDACNLNATTWEISDKELKYLSSAKKCVVISLNTNDISVTIDASVDEVCKQLNEEGISNKTYTFAN